VDQINYMAQKSLQGTSLCNACSQKRKLEYKRFNPQVDGSPILEYGAAFWDQCREGQINALDRLQRKAAQFANNTKAP
jgi:hypothetical protein